MVKIYVEGGGDTNSLKTTCRKGLSGLLNRAGFKGRMPRVTACGSRGNAYNSFCVACGNADRGDFIVLLVDSEESVAHSVWKHLKTRDQWPTPRGVTDEQAHLMIQCMETWIVSDRNNLAEYFGNGFKPDKLPSLENLETVPKDTVLSKLQSASKDSRPKRKYQKGRDSFMLLEQTDPDALKTACPSAARFFKVLDNKCRVG